MSRVYYVDEYKYTKNGGRIGPSGSLSLEQLALLTGITYRQVKVDLYNQDAIIASIPESAAYEYRDVVEISPQTMGLNYNKTLALFDKEHIHCNDEVRFFLEGSAFYEIRDLDDNWIRMNAEPGDYLSIPKGVFHRFFLDKSQHVKAIRLFAKDPVWTGLYRSHGADTHPARQEYLAKMRAQNID